MTTKVVLSTMIIDDSEADRYLCLHSLKEASGFEYVQEFQAADLALEKFIAYEQSRLKNPGRFPPTVIFLDINMPRMDGFEFLEELGKIESMLEEGHELPLTVLIVTSSNTDEEKQRAMSFRCVKGYFTKPLTVEDADNIREQFGVAA